MSAAEEEPQGTKTITDCFGQAVRLTDERVAHILEHQEMNEMGAEIKQLLAAPQIVRR
jgi:hypothetical protein